MTQTPESTMDPALERELVALERKLATLVNHTRALRAANDTLRRDLAAAYDKNRALQERVNAATDRVDALLARLPEAAE